MQYDRYVPFLFFLIPFSNSVQQMLVWLFESAKHHSKNTQIQSLLSNHFQDLYAVTDNQSCTLLHITADYNHQLLAFILQRYDEEVTHRLHSNTQAERKFEGGQQEDTTKQMIDKRSWVDMEDQQGNTALHYAAFRNCVRAVKILELHGADHTKKNKNGLNCLHLAAEGGSPALIYRFKAKGLNPDSTDHSGNTPLHWAAHAGMEYSISALTPLTGRIDQQEQTGNTPLHLAAALGWTRIVRKLIIAGADFTMKNNQGKNSIDLAHQNGHEEIVQMMRDNFHLRDLLLIRPSLIPTTPKHYASTICIVFTTLTIIPNMVSLMSYREGLPYVLTIISLVLGVLTALMYTTLRCSDPGTVRNRQLSGEEYLLLLEQNKPKMICFECKVLLSLTSPVETSSSFSPLPHLQQMREGLRSPLSLDQQLHRDEQLPVVRPASSGHNSLPHNYSIHACCPYTHRSIKGMTLTFDYQELSGVVMLHLVLGTVAILCSLLLIVPLGYLCFRQLFFSGKGITTLQAFLREIREERLEFRMKQRVQYMLKQRKMMNQSLLEGKPNRSNTVQTVQKGESQVSGPMRRQDISCLQNWRMMFCSNQYEPLYG